MKRTPQLYTSPQEPQRIISEIPLLKSPIEELDSEEEEAESEDDDNPLLFVDVNLGPEK